MNSLPDDATSLAQVDSETIERTRNRVDIPDFLSEILSAHGSNFTDKTSTQVLSSSTSSIKMEIVVSAKVTTMYSSPAQKKAGGGLYETRSSTSISSSSEASYEDSKEVDALAVARYFLRRVDREAGDTISPLKLQKLVYYAQAWSLVFQNQPIFPEPIEAWVHGPVVYKVWSAYKNYKYSAIPEPEETLADFTDAQIEVLDEVWSAYGELSAKHLEQLTHSELPWLNARKGLNAGEKSNQTISHEDMKSYYAPLLVQDSEQADSKTI